MCNICHGVAARGSVNVVMQPAPVIALVGRRRSGKDAAADALLAAVAGAVRLNFSDPVIAELERELGVQITPENKGEYRDALQALGRRRRQQEPGYWTRQLSVAIAEARRHAALVVVCGAREDSDMALMSSFGAYVIMVRRPGTETGGVPTWAYGWARRLPLSLHHLLPRAWRAGVHPNEVAIDRIAADCTLVNDADLAALEQSVIQAYALGVGRAA